MNESGKAFLALVVAGCWLMGLMTWIGDPPEGEESLFLWFRIGFPAIGLGCLLPLLWAYYRKNKIPDFLAQVSPGYFERDGFCFALGSDVQVGRCSLLVYFQNRYERPCNAQVLIRTSSSLFKGRLQMEDVTLGVRCGPAAFGCSSIPWAIPEEIQGRTISLDVVAGVDYPEGKGRLLRFRDGTQVGAIEMDFWREGLQITGAALGTIVLMDEAKIKFPIPSGVASSVEGDLTAHTTTLWQLGEPFPNASSFVR